MKLAIRRCTFEELTKARGFRELVQEYADEFALEEPGKAGVRIERYKALDEAGELRCLGVFDADVLAGAALVQVFDSGHYDGPVLGLDSFYLRKPWRKGTNGLRFLQSVRQLVRDEDAAGMPIMCPPGSALDRLCEAKGWKLTHRAYWMPAQ